MCIRDRLQALSLNSWSSTTGRAMFSPETKQQCIGLSPHVSRPAITEWALPTDLRQHKCSLPLERKGHLFLHILLCLKNKQNKTKHKSTHSVFSFQGSISWSGSPCSHGINPRQHWPCSGLNDFCWCQIGWTAAHFAQRLHQHVILMISNTNAYFAWTVIQ